MPMVLEAKPSSTTKTIRKRKTHNKSRKGCGNCKLRRVKCDENKPECRRCTNFGVSCSYDGKTDLEPSMEVSISIPLNNNYNERILSFITSPQPATTSTSSEADSEFDTEDHAVLERFKNRTVHSLGTDTSRHLYGRVLPELALEHNFLFHLLVTLTLMHDRFLDDVKLEDPSKQSEAEAYHWYQGTVIFNTHLRHLYSPSPSSHLDAMWGSAVALGCIAFFCVEGDTPHAVWPLKPAGALDLDWLKISDGKKEVWRAANPLRPDSAYAALAAEQISLLAPALLDEPVVPEGWRALWGAYPYQRAASVMGQLMGMEMTRRTVLQFLTFIAHVEGEFARLLGEREPKAMLLLGVWYAKVCWYRQWWTMRRAVLEGQAIAIYLEREHKDLVEGEGAHLWEFVRRGTGLEKGWGWRDFAREAGLGDTGEEKRSMCERAGFELFQAGDLT